MNRMEYAACYHGFGMNLLPTKADKRPNAETWDEWKVRRQTSADLVSLEWGDKATSGLAAIAGSVSGCLVALDLDEAPGDPAVDLLLGRLGLPRDYPWTVRTPGRGGGWHVWVRSPDLPEVLAGDNRGKLVGDWPGADHLELRWERCYTLLPPSQHPEGRYEFREGKYTVPETPPAEVPGKSLVRLSDWAKRERVAAPRLDGYDAYIRAAIEGECGRVAMAPEGGRNDQLYRSAFKLGTLEHAGASEDECGAALLAAARRAGLKDFEAKRTIDSGWSDGLECPADMSGVRRRTTEPAPIAPTSPPAEEPPAAEKVGVSLLEAIRDVSRYRDTPMPPGVDFPWGPVNRKTRGLRPGWLSILAGYPGHGKTSAAMAIVTGAAKRGQTTLMDSLEMSAEELALRLVQYWGLNADRLYEGRITDDDRDAFDLAANFEPYERVRIISERSLQALEKRVQAMKPDLVVVDYIGLMDMGRDSATEGTTRISRGLKALARKYEVPVLALSQLSRPADKQKVLPPTMFDLRASGALEADADHILIVFRDDSKDDADGRNDGQVEGRFIVAKSRHAPAGKPVPFLFDGSRQLFELMAPARDRAEGYGWSVHEGGQQ